MNSPETTVAKPEAPCVHIAVLKPDYLAVDVAAYDKEIVGRPVVRIGYSTGAVTGSMLVAPATARQIAAAILASVEHLEAIEAA